jgi:predicted ATP-grasp superfamily ATP-dependent carboligase
MRILVTNCHTRMGYAVVRSLTRGGHSVVAGGRSSPTMCHRLPGVTSEFAYPDAFEEPEGMVQALEEHLTKDEIDLLFPVHEEMFVVSYYHERLSRAALVLAPDIEAMMRAHDKATVPLYARKCSIPVPETVLTDSSASLESLVEQVGLPLVLKPRFGSGSNKVLLVRERRQLKDAAAVFVSGSALIAQSYFEGVGVGFAGLVWQGRVLALSGHQRLREVPISGGSSTARATFYHPEIRRATERLLPQLSIDGVVMAEYRYNPATDALCLLELNPRYWGGLPTAINSGVDFPLLHLKAALGEPLAEAPVLPSRQVEGRWLLGELRSLVELLQLRRWRDAGTMLYSRPSWPVYWDDIDWRRPDAFGYQARAYYRILKEQGNAGGHSSAKDAFFTRVAAEKSKLT